MKLSKYYLLKKSKTDEIISITSTIIDIHNRKTTRRINDSPTRRVGEYDNFGLFLRPSIIALYKKSSLYFLFGTDSDQNRIT
jgi:hypothetical protein